MSQMGRVVIMNRSVWIWWMVREGQYIGLVLDSGIHILVRIHLLQVEEIVLLVVLGIT